MLDQQPDDVLVHIFPYLAVRDLVAVASVSKRLWDGDLSSHAWRERVRADFFPFEASFDPAGVTGGRAWSHLYRSAIDTACTEDSAAGEASERKFAERRASLERSRLRALFFVLARGMGLIVVPTLFVSQLILLLIKLSHPASLSHVQALSPSIVGIPLQCATSAALMRRRMRSEAIAISSRSSLLVDRFVSEMLKQHCIVRFAFLFVSAALFVAVLMTGLNLDGRVAGSPLLWCIPILTSLPCCFVGFLALKRVFRAGEGGACLLFFYMVLGAAQVVLIILRVELGAEGFPLSVALIPAYVAATPFAVSGCAFVTFDVGLYLGRLVCCFRIRRQPDLARFAVGLAFTGGVFFFLFPLAFQDHERVRFSWATCLIPYIVATIVLWVGVVVNHVRRTRDTYRRELDSILDPNFQFSLLDVPAVLRSDIHELAPV